MTTPLSEIVRSLIPPTENSQDLPRHYRFCIKNPGYIDAIRNRQKAVDARFSDKYLQKMAPGSLVTFRNWNRSVTCRVTSKKTYPNIKELLISEGVEQCFPPHTSVVKGIDIFKKFTTNVQNADLQRVVAIRFEPHDSFRRPAVLQFR